MVARRKIFRRLKRFTRIAALSVMGCLAAEAQPPAASIAQIETLIRSRHYDAALQQIRSALRRTPKDSRLWTLKGIVFSLEGSRENALHAFHMALDASPNNLAALKGETQLLYETHDPRAIPLLERISQMDPGDVTAHEMLGVLQAKGNCRAALRQFALSAQVLDRHPESLEAYGRCLAETGQLQEAIAEFQRLASFVPAAYPKYDIAVLYLQEKRYQDAAQTLEPLLGPEQTDPDVLSLASDAYEAMGDTPKAAALLRRAIVLRPQDPALYVSFAALCLDHDSFQVGIDMIDAGLQRIPKNSSLYLSRGLLRAQLDQFDAAEADFEKAESLDPKQSLPSYAMDLVELQRTHFDYSHSDETVKSLRSQIAAHPDSSQLRYLLAKLLAMEGSPVQSEAYREAIRSAETAIQLQPDFLAARDLLADLYLRSGQYDLATTQCRHALQISPSDRTALFHLITALRRSQRSEDRAELPVLVKRFSDLEKASLQEETARKKFRLVEQPPAPAQ